MATTKPISFFTPYDRTPAVRLECKDPSLAQQHFKDEVDINVLLEKFKVTGQMPSGLRLPTYGDFTGINDYQTALNALNLARDEFMRVPATIRARFGNSPQAFMEFCSDPANAEELQRLGLSDKQQAASPPAAGTAALPDTGPTASKP